MVWASNELAERDLSVLPGAIRTNGVNALEEGGRSRTSTSGIYSVRKYSAFSVEADANKKQLRADRRILSCYKNMNTANSDFG